MLGKDIYGMTTIVSKQLVPLINGKIVFDSFKSRNPGGEDIQPTKAHIR
jgi:hypothetical protein